MEKYVDILAAIAAARAAIVAPKKIEKEFARNAVKIAYKSGTDAELAAAEAAYKAVTSSRVDTTALKKDMPDVAARYTKTTETRRFIFA